MNDPIHLIARIIARLNDHRKHGRISEAQWYRLAAAVLSEFKE